MRPVLTIVIPFDSGRDIDIALAATVIVNLHQMRSRQLPPLYASGVRYQRERCLVSSVPETCERFLSAEQLLRERVGDCDDLASYLAAEKIHTGEDPGARAIALRVGRGYHAVVRCGDGTLEDPSVRLGMPYSARAHSQLMAAFAQREAGA